MFLGYNSTNTKISYKKRRIIEYEYKQEIAAIDIGIVLMLSR